MPGWTSRAPLLVVRHAKSDQRAGVPDHERPLNDARTARRAGARPLARPGTGRRIDLVLCSSAVRAQQTWDLAAGRARRRAAAGRHGRAVRDVARPACWRCCTRWTTTSERWPWSGTSRPSRPSCGLLAGSADAGAEPACTRASPTSGVAVLELSGSWSDLAEGCCLPVRAGGAPRPSAGWPGRPRRSASSISSRGMPSRYRTASRNGTLTVASARSRTTGLALKAMPSPAALSMSRSFAPSPIAIGAGQRKRPRTRRTGAARPPCPPGRRRRRCTRPVSTPSTTSSRLASTCSMPERARPAAAITSRKPPETSATVKPSRCSVRTSVRAPGVSSMASPDLVEHGRRQAGQLGDPLVQAAARSRARRASPAR